MSKRGDRSAAYEALLRDVRVRMVRLEIEQHRIKAILARLEALQEDEVADKLSYLLANHADDRAFATALTSFVDASEGPGEGIEVGGSTPTAGRDSRRAAAHARSPKTSRAATRSAVVVPRPANIEPAPAAPKPSTKPARAAQATAASRLRKKRRGAPPWVTSVAVHCALLFALALVTFASLQETEPTLTASFSRPSEVEVAALAEFEVTSVELVRDEPVPAPLAPDLETLELRMPTDQKHDSASFPLGASGELTDLPLGASPWLAAGAGGQDKGNGGGDDLRGANFFGAESQADRIVFVVDNSNSMDEGRFETAMAELARSIDALAAKQSFYVVFYSDAAYRLFHPFSEEEPVPATLENKERLRAWLTTVEMCVGGRLVDAMRIAADLDPHVVYLLSDGVISDYPVSYLTEPKGWDFTIHTIGMTVPDRRAAQNLMAIAAANGGVFRAVGVTPLAREIARRRPVKKNRTRGQVWGIRLPPGEL